MLTPDCLATVSLVPIARVYLPKRVNLKRYRVTQAKTTKKVIWNHVCFKNEKSPYRVTASVPVK